jgi:hypothetical protein
MPIADLSIVALRCEFVVPAPVDVAEPPTGDVPTEPVNPRIEAVRRDLDADDRWSCSRVTPVRQADPADGWHVLVWTIPLSDRVEDLARACEGVHDIVTSCVPGATLLACGRSER